MKSTLLLLLLLLCLSASAQFEKGDRFIGGSMSFNNNAQVASPAARSTWDNSSFEILPAFGYLISQKYSIGVEAGYGFSAHSSSYDVYSTASNSRSVTAGVLGSRYFGISDKLLFALQARVAFQRGRNELATSNPTIPSYDHAGSDSYRLMSTISPVFIYFPTARWALRGSIGNVGHMFSKDLTNETRQHSTHAYFGGISFGLFYIF